MHAETSMSNMRKLVCASALFFAASCSILHQRDKTAALAQAEPDDQWWHNRKVVAALSLTPAQQIALDTIGRRAQNDLGVLQHEAEIAGSFVDDALGSDPFDGNAYEYVVGDYTKCQARVVARDLQRAGEIRSVLSLRQWLALQKELGGTALQVQTQTLGEQ
jgi:hypothetical protein